MSNRIRRLAAVVVCFVLAVVAGTVPAAGALAPSQEKVRIAVMNFENNSQWHWWGDRLGEAAADELVTQLFQTGKFSVVERSQINAVLAEQDFGQSGRVNPSQAADIGKILGVQVILTGSITKFAIDEKGGGFGRVGVLEVTRVLAQSSICRVVEGEAAEGDKLVPIGG